MSKEKYEILMAGDKDRLLLILDINDPEIVKNIQEKGISDIKGIRIIREKGELPARCSEEDYYCMEDYMPQ